MRRTGRAGRGIIGAACAATTAAALAIGVGAAPAQAQAEATAGCPESVRDSYGAGDEVTVVGYTKSCIGETADPATPPAVFGYLHSEPCASVDLPYCEALQGVAVPSRGTPLGQFALASTRADTERGLRMELTFQLPEGLASGLYYLVVCQGACDGPASSGPATPLYVGVDPPPDGRPVRHWPIDDPAVAELPDTALVDIGDGETPLTGAQARALSGVTTVDTQAAGSHDDPPPSRGWRPPGGSLAIGGAALAVVAALFVVAGTWRRAGVRNPAVAGAVDPGSAPGVGAGHAPGPRGPDGTRYRPRTAPSPATRRKQIRGSDQLSGRPAERPSGRAAERLSGP
jgi:hypothetical protein